MGLLLIRYLFFDYLYPLTLAVMSLSNYLLKSIVLELHLFPLSATDCLFLNYRPLHLIIRYVLKINGLLLIVICNTCDSTFENS